MRTRSLVLVAGVLVGVAWPLSGEARKTVRTPRPRIVNGTFTSVFPTVGALLEGSSVGSSSMQCTGTMIGCQTFITAAHCVCDTTGTDCQPGGPNEPNPSRLFVFLQHAGVFTVSSVSLRSDYDFPVADVAVLTLSAPVAGIRPTPLNLAGAPSAGATGTIVGFGRQGNGIYDYGLKRTGLVSLAPCTGGVSNTTSVCWNFLDPLGAAGTNSNTCNGDSGGPLFVDGGCGPVIAGITSGGDSAECVPTDASYDANVYNYRSFIQTAGGADLSNTSCGAMPQVGEAGTTIDSASGTLSSLSPDGTHQFVVPVGTDELRVGLNAIDDGGDYDLYVRFGSDPTTSVYDCRDNAGYAYGYCVIAAPAAGTWHVLVHRVSGSGDYQVTATAIAPGSAGPGTDGQSCSSSRPCVTGGTCSGGQCASSPSPDGTPCSDGLICTAGDVCTAGACAGTATPLASCDTVPSGKSTVGVKNSATDAKDSLRWNWTHGSATFGAFGDPSGSTPYEMCVFDHAGGVPVLAFDQSIAPSGKWSTTAAGFKFRDTAGSEGGVTSVTLRAGRVPTLPFAQSPSVTVQLSNGTHCWQSTSSSNRKNDATQFKGSSD